jgi:HNH endonuclease
VKTIELVSKEIVLVDDDFHSKANQYVWFRRGHGTRNIYACRQEKLRKGKYKPILMHREIMGIDDPAVLIDHIDGNGLNNCSSNLRLANRAENGRNRVRLDKNNKSGFRGVCKFRGLWRAYIHVAGKSIHLGTYETKEEAAMVFDEAAKKYFGTFCGILNT